VNNRIISKIVVLAALFLQELLKAGHGIISKLLMFGGKLVDEADVVPEFLEVVVNDVSVVNELISMSHKIP
jgi:hypothetical protein